MHLLSPALPQHTLPQNLGILPSFFREVRLVLAVRLLLVHNGFEVVFHCVRLVFILDLTLVQLTLVVRLVFLHLQSHSYWLSHLADILVELFYAVSTLRVHLLTLLWEEKKGDLLFLLGV